MQARVRTEGVGSSRPGFDPRPSGPFTLSAMVDQLVARLSLSGVDGQPVARRSTSAGKPVLDREEARWD